MNNNTMNMNKQDEMNNEHGRVGENGAHLREERSQADGNAASHAEMMAVASNDNIMMGMGDMTNVKAPAMAMAATAPLPEAALAAAGEGEDREDAESTSGGSASSSRSSSQEMTRNGGSGSGGYSGDYSSISDSSSGASRPKNNRPGKNKNRRQHHHAEEPLNHSGAHAVLLRQEDGAGSSSMACSEDVSKLGGEGGVAITRGPSTASHVIKAPQETNVDGMIGSVRFDHAMELNGHYATALRHASNHPESTEERKEDTGIRPRHHIHYHHHNHPHHHHHLPRGLKNNSSEVNRKIDEIMNLYQVSLEAANVKDDTKKGSTALNGMEQNDLSKPEGVNLKSDTNQAMHFEVEGTGLPTHLQPNMEESAILKSINVLGHNAPQIGGVRISDPSDPRIDLNKLYNASLSFPSSLENQQTNNNSGSTSKLSETSGTNNAPTTGQSKSGESDDRMDDCYSNLMEACRPFFRDNQALLANRHLIYNNTPYIHASDGAQSSSGFTSFFTTTKGESNNTNSGSGGSFSEFSHLNATLKCPQHQDVLENDALNLVQQQQQQQQQKQEEPQVTTHDNGSLAKPQDVEDGPLDAAHTSGSNDADQSDSSSMVVLARVKRKHKEQKQAATSSSNSDNTTEKKSDGNNKRVRIEAVALDMAKSRESKPLLPKSSQLQHPAKQSQSSGPPAQNQDRQQQRNESSSLTSSLSTSIDSSGSDSGGLGGQPNKAEGNSTLDADKRPTEANQAANPHVVTDISSGTATANNSSGSGTGSGNDTMNENNATASKSESGSGGDGVTDEQKVSGERDSTGGSDTGAAEFTAVVNDETKQENQSVAQDSKPLIHHHHHGGRHLTNINRFEKSETGKMAGLEPGTDDARNNNIDNNIHQEDVEAMVSEKKIMEKKRKRMNMRREYEEEVQRQMRDSSESSSRPHETALEPGRPVTLEEVLSFTKTARLLVQALPPFLAVHANAAFTTLCGVDSHAAIGKPISQIISLPEVNPNKESDASTSDNTNNKDAMSSLSGSVECNGQNDSSMATSGAMVDEQQRDPLPEAGDNGNFQNDLEQQGAQCGLRIDRLIVARGYGHIHNVEVVFVPHHSNSHALEGSEVKIIEGNGPQKRRKKDDSKILCRMSVSPVISSTRNETITAHNEGSTDTKASHQASVCSKRRKHRHCAPGNNGERNYESITTNELITVKHYLIQLEPIDGPRTLKSRSSFFSTSSDTTMEAQLLGITKTEVLARRCRAESRHRHDAEVQQVNAGNQEYIQEAEESQDENGSAMEPVATCG